MPQNNLGLWYQEAVINGVAMPPRRQDGDTSERRYQTFIEPFLQGQSGRLVELGCNAGYYLRKASELGYEAIGVENDPLYLSQARFWEEQEPLGINIIDKDLNDYDIPLAHIVLLANVTYWLTPDQIFQLVNKLRRRVMKVIVVSRFRPLKPHKSDCRQEWLYDVFRGWEQSNPILGKKHWSICFKNNILKEVDIDLVKIGDFDPELKKHFIKSFNRFLYKLDTNTLGEFKTLHYYRHLHHRGIRRKGRSMYINRYIKTYHYMKKNGLWRPLQTKKTNDGYIIVDGNHRYLIAKYLGIKKVMCLIAEHRYIPSRNKSL